AGLLGQPERILDAHDADLLTLWPDETHLGDADPVVDAGLSADGASLVDSGADRGLGVFAGNGKEPRELALAGPTLDRSARCDQDDRDATRPGANAAADRTRPLDADRVGAGLLLPAPAGDAE